MADTKKFIGDVTNVETISDASTVISVADNAVCQITKGNLLSDVTDDISNIKNAISYGSGFTNTMLYSAIMSIAGYIGRTGSYNSDTGNWSFNATSEITNGAIYSALAQIIHQFGGNFTVNQDYTILVGRDGSPYAPADHYNWLVLITQMLNGVAPSRGSSEWTWGGYIDSDTLRTAIKSAQGNTLYHYLKEVYFDNKWDGTTKNYYTDCIVVNHSDNKLYRCIADVTAAADIANPSTDTTHWQVLG